MGIKNPFADRPTIKLTTGKGGSAGLLEEKDRARGLVPGTGQGGTAGLAPATRTAVAAAAKAGRPNKKWLSEGRR